MTSCTKVVCISFPAAESTLMHKLFMSISPIGQPVAVRTTNHKTHVCELTKNMLTKMLTNTQRQHRNRYHKPTDCGRVNNLCIQNGLSLPLKNRDSLSHKGNDGVGAAIYLRLEEMILHGIVGYFRQTTRARGQCIGQCEGRSYFGAGLRGNLLVGVRKLGTWWKFLFEPVKGKLAGYQVGECW